VAELVPVPVAESLLSGEEFVLVSPDDELAGTDGLESGCGVGLTEGDVDAAGFFLAFLVVLVVEVCGVAGALEGGVLCANIAAAVNIVVRIMRFIFVSPLMGCFRSPLATPSCSRMPFGTLALAGD